MAPESLATMSYSKKTDVWSFGIVGTVSTLNVFLFRMLFESLSILVYEIVAQCEPHKDKKDLLEVALAIR
jgi:serine/threonine protein kinase